MSVEPHRCPECSTELTAVVGRRSGATAWWCWRCEQHVRVSFAAERARRQAVREERRTRGDAA